MRNHTVPLLIGLALGAMLTTLSFHTTIKIMGREHERLAKMSRESEARLAAMEEFCQSCCKARK